MFLDFFLFRGLNSVKAQKERVRAGGTEGRWEQITYKTKHSKTWDACQSNTDRKTKVWNSGSERKKTEQKLMTPPSRHMFGDRHIFLWFTQRVTFICKWCCLRKLSGTKERRWGEYFRCTNWQNKDCEHVLNSLEEGSPSPILQRLSSAPTPYSLSIPQTSCPFAVPLRTMHLQKQLSSHLWERQREPNALGCHQNVTSLAI